MGDVMRYELDAARVEPGQGSAEKQRCALSEQACGRPSQPSEVTSASAAAEPGKGRTSRPRRRCRPAPGRPQPSTTGRPARAPPRSRRGPDACRASGGSNRSSSAAPITTPVHDQRRSGVVKHGIDPKNTHGAFPPQIQKRCEGCPHC